MDEDEAFAWLDRHGWGAGQAYDRLRQLCALVIEESGRQNLISAATMASIWSRHIVDSAQLLALAQRGDRSIEGSWVDLGTGAGFPGLVIACLSAMPMTLVEMRRLRADFLRHCIDVLALSHTNVAQSKAQAVTLDGPATYISARAFAPLDRLFNDAHHLADAETLWLLPKGRHAQDELATTMQQWQGVFHVEQSVTDHDSVIVTATQVSRRPQRPKVTRSRSR